jgi:hypothetical protein
VIPSEITGALLRPTPQSTPCYSSLPPSAQFCETKTVEIRVGSFEAVGGSPQLHSTGVVLRDVFQGPSRRDGSCGPGTDGEVGCRQGELEETLWQSQWR